MANKCLEGFGGRIRDAIRDSGKTQLEIARELDINPSQLSRWISGKNSPSAETLYEISRKTRASIEWILSGQGGLSGNQKLAAARESSLGGGEYGEIPFLIFDENSETGFVQMPNPEFKAAFRNEFLMQKGGAENFFLTSVQGDSMSPTLNAGDTVLVDRSISSIGAEGGIYAIKAGAFFIKRARLLPNSIVEILSDNSLYNPLRLSLAEVGVLGKIVWTGKKMA